MRLLKVFFFFFLFMTLSERAFPLSLDIKKDVLKNGLSVIHLERKNLPLVMVTLLVKASPLDEPERLAGLSSLTASLLTEGTKKRTSKQISEEIEFIGASIGQSVDYDFTTLTLSVLKKDLDKGFEIFSDVLLEPVFSEPEIARKKDLIKGNLRKAEDDPRFIADREFRKSLYGGHPYGRLIEGYPETIDNIKRDDIVRFYSDYFVPNNSILVVVGDISGEELNSLIKKYLSSWKPKDIKRSSFEAKKPSGKNVVVVDKPITQANIIFGGLGIRRSDPDYYAISVMNYILGGGGFSSRLMQKIRDEMGLAYDVHSFFSPSKEPGIFQVQMQTKNESANISIETILGEIKRLKDSGATPSEIEDAKAFLVGSFPGRFDTMRKIADFLALIEFYGLGLDYMEKYPRYIESVTPEDIKRVAQRYLDTENYVLVVVGDKKKTGIGK